MALNTGFITPRLLVSVAASFFLVLLISYSVLFPGHRIGSAKIDTRRIFQSHLAPPKKQHVSFQDALQAIYHPLVKSITAETFTDSTDGTVYHMNNSNPDWTHSLGKQFCIVDIDTRFQNESGQLFHNDNLNWDSVEGVSSGIPNHYLYAAIHGYDYKYIHTTEWPNSARDNVWTKIPALRELLKQYRLVLSMDGDAIFTNLELPFEWLLNRWNFTMETSIAMPWDVDTWYTYNKYGDLNPNAGVALAQNLDRTFEILDTWIGCPDHIEDCDHFRHGWPAEQGAFGDYIIPHFNETTDFMGVSCDDAMGFPNQGFGCKGNFIRHFTTGKDQVKGAMSNVLMQTLMSRTRMEMLGDEARDGVIVKMDSLDLVGKDDWGPESEA